MKMKSFLLVLMVIVLGMTLGGCGCFMQQMKGETPPPPPPQAKVVAPETKKEIPVAAPAPAAPAPIVALNDINFDFDKYNIRPGDANILKGNAEWFKANPGKKMRVEGNCDERGTVEYNLALGQKRADAAKAYIVNLGVDGKALETVSYGKERPADPGHNEAAWAKNRRAHFLALP
ncbi:MAG: peptidoglycan-associated lipoprotein Pal [Proteobacteria bacterium]|nr:peptidoglycan-associated lipoprotein Pal [Pseudomonadota bacterium]